MTYSFVRIRLLFVRPFVGTSDVFVCVFVVALGRSLIHLSIFLPSYFFVRPFIHLLVCLLVHPTPDRSINSPFTHFYIQALMFLSSHLVEMPLSQHLFRRVWTCWKSCGTFTCSFLDIFTTSTTRLEMYFCAVLVNNQCFGMIPETFVVFCFRFLSSSHQITNI